MDNATIAKSLGVLMAILLLSVVVWPLRNELNREYDMQVSDDLTSVSSAIDNYFSINSMLPESLEEIELDNELERRAADRGYEYNSGSLGEYELCANFKTDSSGVDADRGLLESLVPAVGNDTRAHSSGRNCFDYEVSNFEAFQWDQPQQTNDLRFEFDDFESQLEELEGLEGLLTPENLETFESLEL